MIILDHTVPEMTVLETYVYLDHTIPDIFAPLDVSMYASQIDPFPFRDRVSILVLAGLELCRPDCLLTHTDVPASLLRAGVSGQHHHISPCHTLLLKIILPGVPRIR